ncbi:replication protein A, subunit RPA32 [Parathielavia hyrcaniae]|uniref:Replication protein A, subunit RPA32 n=1 Tax=Parathielavia hyrcaniae TaxID=113614 RepID=A0AAN6Q639_9PEZI|nr:replication protein A, subunit RPA32 [Parathielavia hyrcaniae]
MTSYGGYQQTSYGGQGGNDGGGFMGASQQGSQGGAQRNYADDTLRPLTIKQLVDFKEPYPNSDLVVDGMLTTQVTLVGHVRVVNPGAVHITYRIDDGTGMIDVKKWIDADKGEATPRFGVDTYVRVYGKLQSFNGKRSIAAHYIRAIEDFNEVNYHLLEATYVHLCLTKAASADGQAPQQGGGGMDAGGDGMFVDGGYGAGGVGADMQARLSPCSRNGRTVFNFLANSATADGAHLNQVASGTGLSARDIMSATEELLGHALIYTTDDDETWAVLEC